MATGKKRHLVILVHGIRDIARWQSEVSHALEQAGLLVAHTNYGRMNLLEFLAPIDFFRQRAADRIWTDIQYARQLHPDADVSIIAHRFGTYVVTRILKQQFTLGLKRLILCGSVVKYDFPFEQIQNRFTPPLINEVGTRDPWPAVAEALTFGYGSAGTFGFNRPGARDRFHNGQSHGYFLTQEFTRKYWVPLLANDQVVDADIEAAAPPLWIKLLSIFKLRYVLAAIVILVAAFYLLRAVYASSGVMLSVPHTDFGPWSAVPPTIAAAEEPCPVPIICSSAFLTGMITDRRYVTVEQTGGNIGAVRSCGGFDFPADGAPPSGDPVAALEALASAFPQCLGATLDSHDKLSLRLAPGGITEVDGTLLCNCTPEQVEAYRSRP